VPTPTGTPSGSAFPAGAAAPPSPSATPSPLLAPARVVVVSLQSQLPVGDATGAAVEGALLAAAAVPEVSVARTVDEAGPPFTLSVARTLPPAAGARRALQGAGADADADAEAAALADRLLNDGNFAYALAAAGVPGDLGYDSLEALMVVRF